MPTALVAIGGNAQVSLSWAASDGATSYVVARATTSGGPYAQVATPATPSVTDAGLVNGTVYYYVVSARNAAGSSSASTQASATPNGAVAPAADVTITVNPAVARAISPYIYGVNNANAASNTYPSGGASSLPSGVTLDRLGGNRLTAYNWENNASNAGSDYYYQNDALLSSSSVAGAAVTSFITEDQSAGRATLITVPMQGLVAADVNGPVSMSNPPDMARFKTVIAAKSSISATPFTTSPPTGDAYVYSDEFLWAVDQYFGNQGIFGPTPATQRVFLSLDNEPELWSSTHSEIQGSQAVTSGAYIAKTIALAQALKAQFPDAVIFAPAHYGFYGLSAWNGELPATPSGSNWFTDKFLAALKNEATTFGRPLVDVYDLHWYPEATDGNGNRVVSLNAASLNDAQVQAIVQAPRSLWDGSYQESSWITTAIGGPINLLPRLRAKIAAVSPTTKLSITEYNNGGAKHIAGTIAQADNLGIFADEGLFAANLWPLTTDEPYVLAGFRAFRNFDGADHHFGDTSVQTTSSNAAKVVVHASTDSARPARVVMVAINRSTAPQLTAISGQPLSGSARSFQMTAASAAGQTVIRPVALPTQPVSGSTLTLTLPPLSVTTIDVY